MDDDERYLIPAQLHLGPHLPQTNGATGETYAETECQSSIKPGQKGSVIINQERHAGQETGQRIEMGSCPSAELPQQMSTPE